MSTIPYNTKLPADVSKESQQLSGAVLRWRDTARLSPSLQLVLEQKCHKAVRCRDIIGLDVLDRSIFWETAMVPVIPVPATAIASPRGHHSNT